MTFLLPTGIALRQHQMHPFSAPPFSGSPPDLLHLNIIVTLSHEHYLPSFVRRHCPSLARHLSVDLVISIEYSRAQHGLRTTHTTTL